MAFPEETKEDLKLVQLLELLLSGNEIQMRHSHFPQPVPRFDGVAFLNKTVTMDVREKIKQMSGDSTEGKYPEQAILYKQKGDWRVGEGGGRVTALWFYFIIGN